MDWERITTTESPVYVTEDDGGFKIESGWRWSDRKGGRVKDGWEAFAGFGPGRRFLGAAATLPEAKALCEKEAQKR